MDEYDDGTVADIVVGKVDGIHAPDGNRLPGPPERLDQALVPATGDLYADQATGLAAPWSAQAVTG